MKSLPWLCVAQEWFVHWPHYSVLLKRAGVSSFGKCNRQSELCREFWTHYGLFYMATAIHPHTFIMSRQHCIGFVYTFWNSCFSWCVWSLFSQTSFQGFIATCLIQWDGRRTKLQPTVETMPSTHVSEHSNVVVFCAIVQVWLLCLHFYCILIF